MALVLTPVSHAAETVRYSGVVLGVDREAGTIILGELREWVDGARAGGHPPSDRRRARDCVYEGSRVVATTITLLDEGRP
jgi:hypothetical protein